jgi:GH24 family phage-related lysozyme (muramidase)
MNDEFNKLLIRSHEGLRLVPYHDSRGILTVGVGFALQMFNSKGEIVPSPAAREICARVQVDYAAVLAGKAITEAQAEAIFALQYSTVADQARIVIPAIEEYPQNAAAVVCDMIFQLGLVGFLKFRNTVAAFRAKDWKAAIAGILDSALAHQVPNRVKQNVELLQGN